MEAMPTAVMEASSLPTAVVTRVGDVSIDVGSDGSGLVVAGAPVVIGDAPAQHALSDRIRHMVEELGLPEEYVHDLLQLVGTDIVVIADDSGSMNRVTDYTDHANPMTRWQELQRTLRMLSTMLLVIEHADGFWLKFLNDDQWYKITVSSQLDDIFLRKPKAYGKTPLLANLQPVVRGHGSDEKDTLLLVLTDGVPSDCSFDQMSDLIRSKPAEVFVSFAMCTDEDDIVELYNQVVDPIPGCDITDDYASEKVEVERTGQELTPYSWLAKMLLVKFPKYDHLDEGKPRKSRPGAPQQQPCCAVS